MRKKIYVYDIETYMDIFTFIFRPVQKGKEYLIFEISSRKNQLRELVSFLKIPHIGIGYNNIFFDYPILHFIMNNPNCTLEELYEEKNEIFASEFPRVPVWNHIHEQVDLMKVWHYDNRARSCSLKWLEFSFDWHKVQDLPFNPNKPVGIENFDKLIEYNINDVDFTYFFTGKSMDMLNFRREMSVFLNHNVMNYSDVKIGEYINRINYEKNSGKRYNEFKDRKTFRGSFKASQLIPRFTRFYTPSFMEFLTELRGIEFKLEDDFEFNPKLGDITVNFMKGGLHSQDEAKVFTAKEGWYLKEEDVGSMYPKSIIEANLYPEHLGPTWRLGIKSLYMERVNEMKPKLKELGKISKISAEYKSLDSKQLAYKLAMNGGGYGKTGSKFSWQYDPLIMMKTTFRGQLSLMMLMEQFHLNGIEIVSANTDGVVIHYPKEKDFKVNEIKKNWENVTKYELEETYYSKIVFRNVNHYLANIIDRETSKTLYAKYKGVFAVDVEPHKNKSQRIVSIALAEYFLKGVPVKDVIENPGYEFLNEKGEKKKTTIYDYCLGRKKVDKVRGYILVTPPGNIFYDDKVIRYYISHSGDVMYKKYKSGKMEAVNKGFSHTIFMNFVEREDYDIDYSYYIRECNKIIKEIELGTKRLGAPSYEQLNLF